MIALDSREVTTYALISFADVFCIVRQAPIDRGFLISHCCYYESIFHVRDAAYVSSKFAKAWGLSRKR